MVKKIKETAEIVVKLLNENYPGETKCYLAHEAPWQLMVSTILSAQCTDDRVNMVTPMLFEKYHSPEALACADTDTLMEIVRSTGFFRSKAKNIILSMRKLVDEYGGVMPSDIAELVKFPGVGRKTANVVRGHVFSIPSIVVDTHVKRVSNRLGLVKTDDPEKIEFELMRLLPEDAWIRYNTQVIAHGRRICTARSPKCGMCFLSGFCPSAHVNL